MLFDQHDSIPIIITNLCTQVLLNKPPTETTHKLDCRHESIPICELIIIRNELIQVEMFSTMQGTPHELEVPKFLPASRTVGQW